jgi:hypothetical protein
MRRHHSDETNETPQQLPSLAAAFAISALAGLLFFNSVHALGAGAALAAVRSAARGSSPQHALAAAHTAPSALEPSLQILLETRVCGSPAVDG